MIRQLRWFRKLASVGFCFALSSALLAGQSPQAAIETNQHNDSPRQVVAEIPTDVDAPVVANKLMLEFNDRAVLTRAEVLKEIDASPAIDQTTAVSILQNSLHDEDPLVRETALSALTRRDSAENPVLPEAEVSSFQGEDAELAKVHFAAKNEDRATLRELIKNGNAPIQEGAFEALATSDLPEAIEVLHAELRDQSSMYRLQTLELFVRSPYTNSSKELLPILQEFDRDRDPLVRDYAKQILKEKKAEAAAENSHESQPGYASDI
jgi:HEAT repeat protein